MKQNDSFEKWPSKVSTGSLTAKEILKTVFACADGLTDEESLEQVRKVVGLGTHIESFGVATKLISSRAGECLQNFLSDLHSLNEAERNDVELAIALKLKQSAKARLLGRPKGAKGRNTEEQIYLAAALQRLGCSGVGMTPFLNPTHYCKDAAKQAVYKFLRRYAVSIKRECGTMSESFACQIVKAKVTIELAERIVNPTF